MFILSLNVYIYLTKCKETSMIELGKSAITTFQIYICWNIFIIVPILYFIVQKRLTSAESNNMSVRFLFFYVIHWSHVSHLDIFQFD